MVNAPLFAMTVMPVALDSTLALMANVSPFIDAVGGSMLRTPRWGVVVAAFLLGMLVDVFYDSLGVHAAVATFTAYSRDWVLRLLEPRGGYTSDRTPNRKMLGDSWFLQYSAVFLFVHILIYCFAEIFSVSINLDFVLRLFITYIFSYICILLPQYLFPVAR